MNLTGLGSKIKDRFTADWRQIDWRRTALLVFLILALFAAIWQWAMPKVRTITTAEFRRVPEIRKVKDVQRVRVPCPEQGIVVLDKKEAAQKLSLPWYLERPLPAAAPQITATADLPETKNGIEAVSVIDLQTGESQIVAREKTAPWFQFRNDGALGLRYGIDQRLDYVGNVYGRWDFLRVRDVYLSANGDLSTGGDAKVQLGVEYRW